MTAPKRRRGKAGVPLTESEARRRDARRDRATHLRVAVEQEAYRQWQAGHLVPCRITLALDANDLDGPEVDAALDAAEPDVDRWEAGELYPTWAQVKLLSELTGYALKFFFLPPNKPVWSTLQYHFPVSALDDSEPISRFKPGARDAKPTPIQGTLL